MKPSTESFGFALKKLSDISSQPASTLACSHLICKNCGFVDRNWERMTRAHIGSECRKPGDGGRLYFHFGIHILVDLIQQAYHAQATAGPPSGPRNQRFGALFTEVIGKKWPESVSELSAKLGSNFKPVSDLMIRAAVKRITFLLQGSAWLMTTEFSTQWINAVLPMVDLFVGMHNEYTRSPLSGSA